MSKQLRSKEGSVARDVAVGDPSVFSVGPRVQHLATLLTLETGWMPVIAQGLSPLRKVDWLPALVTAPHPGLGLVEILN